jgi:hypothetical protein
VRAQEQPVLAFPAALHEERVHGVTRGMVGREVERPEVQPIGLDVRAVRDLVAQRREGGFDPPPHDRERVQPPDVRKARRQRHVDGERLLPLKAFEENGFFFE